MNYDFTLYYAAKQADSAFQAALVEQFGGRRAGDMRYYSRCHNEKTKAAASAKHSADAAWLAEMRRQDVEDEQHLNLHDMIETIEV